MARITMSRFMKLAYRYVFNHLLGFLLVPTLIATMLDVLTMGPDDFAALSSTLKAIDPVHALLYAFPAMLVATICFMKRPLPVYLLDFACYKPPEQWRFPFSKFMHHTHHIPTFEPGSVEFQHRLLERSGLGDDTSLPPAHHVIPFNPTKAGSRAESEMVIFSVIDELFAKTGVKPLDVDILVVNCSLFSPTPSLTAMIVNKYKMRSNIRSFNLGGMGCSAGLISIDLAKDQLRAHPGSRALVVTTEIITQYWYTGNLRPMLVANCLFRMGGAAVLLSNRRDDGRRAKYRLLHVVRTHMGADDRSYGCVYEQEDAQRKVGISLSKDLMEIAGSALRTNITALGPLVLPVSEQLLFLLSLLGRKLVNPKWRLYVPDFTQAFEHFCIHAGGRAVIEELAKHLRLSAENVEPSRMTLHRFGNTSSSSPWYELGYVEAKSRMRKGDRVWQIGLGSGFKCNSAVWRCLRSVKKEGNEGAWSGCIDNYPVHIPEVHH
ncbi:hypothetical protein Taro_017122 [Colocasia esculenta]|uniref:3-ketoacyl-CoA synthase n=1 Tax=Colocasia esculenta TaxID=4460 RepID=A0A843UQD0_COLES|nr:hypothetical protein [Colocasia esculenta]